MELATIDNLDWETITPNEEGDWINQRNGVFESFSPIGDKDGGAGLFRLHCGGLNTARDAWVYNASNAELRRNVERMVSFYNAEVERYPGTGDVEDFINTDPSKFSWNRADKAQLARGVQYSIASSGYRVGAYRPFNKQNVHFSRQLNDMVYRLNDVYPTPDAENIGFYIVGVGTEKPFSALAVNEIPNLSYWGSGLGQFFPRYPYTAAPAREADLFGELESTSDGPQRIDNITDKALAEYLSVYGPGVSKDDIFFYVYGLLHSPD